MDLIGTKSCGGGEGHRAPFIIRFAWLSTCHESLPLLDHIPNQALYKSVQSQQALAQNQSYPQMSPANLGFEKNLQGVLVHFIPLRNCNKLLILPVCSGTARRTEFYTEGQRHHVESTLAHSIISPRLFVVQSSIHAVTCSTAHSSTYSFTISVSHILSRSIRTLTAVSSSCSLILQSYTQSSVTCFICQKSHSVLIRSLSHALSLLFSCSFARSVFHTSQFSFNRSIFLSLLIRPFCRSLLSFYQNTDF